MVYKCIESYSDVLTAISQKNGKIIYAGVSLGLKGMLNLILFLVTYHFAKDLTLSVGLMTVGSLLVLLVYDFYTTRIFYNQTDAFRNVNVKAIVSLLYIGLWTMIYVFFSTAFNSIPKLVIKQICDYELLGVYSSISVPTVIITTFAAGIHMPIVPKMAKSYYFGNKKSFVQLLLFTELAIIALSVIAIFLSVFFMVLMAQLVLLEIGKDDFCVVVTL